MNKYFKYRLYAEYNLLEIYGVDFADALLHSRIKEVDKFDDALERVPGEVLNIVKVVGIEDTANSTRGNDDTFERVVVELDTGKRVAIDGKFVCELFGK